MKLAVAFALFVFNATDARGSSSQTIEVWMIINTGSDSGQKSFRAPSYIQFTTGSMNAQLLTASAEIPAQDDPLPDDEFFRALDEMRIHREPRRLADLSTCGPDLNCFQDSSGHPTSSFSSDMTVIEPRADGIGLHIDTATIASTQTAQTIVAVVGISGPIVVESPAAPDELYPNSAPDCVMLKASGAVSGEWFQIGPLR